MPSRRGHDTTSPCRRRQIARFAEWSTRWPSQTHAPLHRIGEDVLEGAELVEQFSLRSCSGFELLDNCCSPALLRLPGNWKPQSPKSILRQLWLCRAAHDSRIVRRLKQFSQEADVHLWPSLKDVGVIVDPEATRNLKSQREESRLCVLAVLAKQDESAIENIVVNPVNNP